MAMTNLSWHYVTIGAVTAPTWNGANYEAPTFVVDAIALAATVLVFCIVDAGLGGAADIVFLGGSATIPSNAVTVIGTPAQLTTATDAGENWYNVRDPGGGPTWLWYGDQSGIVNSMTDSTALGGFIA